MIKKRVGYFLFFFIAVSALFGSAASIAVEGPYLGLEYGEQTGLGKGDVRTTVARIIQVSLGLLGIVAVSLIVYAGFLWMTGGGNEDNVTKAKSILVTSIIGLAIILAAYSITQFVFRNLYQATTGNVLKE